MIEAGGLFILSSLVGYFIFNHRRIDRHDTSIKVICTKLDYIKEGVDELKEKL